MYWYRQRVPKDIAARAKGERVAVFVGGTVRHITTGDALKVSLGTKDTSEAKTRAKDVQGQFDLIWSSFRDAEAVLTLKQAVGLAGEVYQDFAALEDDPSSPKIWAHVRSVNADVATARPVPHPLTISNAVADPLEERFGGFVDSVLARHHLRVTTESRRKVLEQTARAMQEVAALLEKRGKGDYSKDTFIEKYPAYEPSVPPPLATGVTFGEIVEAERQHRSTGLGAKFKPLPPKTIRKYTSIVDAFAKFRGVAGDRADTVTAAELEEWKATLLTGGQCSPRTVADKIGTVKTVLSWGAARFKSSALKAALASVSEVELPGFTKKRSDVSALRMGEAVQVLQATRRETDPRTRWLPWLCAYTGARINEVANLETGDILEAEGYWFFKISPTGKRSVKNDNAIRWVPLHPALIAEGFLGFAEKAPKGRLFASGASQYVTKWFHDERGAAIKREGVAPNHGWRHLFEDLCIRYGVSDSAKKYITGRAKGGSDEDYGKTTARLPGLAREIGKIEPFLVT
ncbi:hypothetical protein JP74_04435 [Devosia sp. 17-2-E-8]|nr:hypothetical protein JP74_04435 [Devosia sp. 17-2-E-8]